MDSDNSQQAGLYSRVVDLLTAPLMSQVITVVEMNDVGKQRQPHSAEFDNLWDDLIATAHHRIECVPCPDNICGHLCVYVFGLTLNYIYIYMCVYYVSVWYVCVSFI